MHRPHLFKKNFTSIFKSSRWYYIAVVQIQNFSGISPQPNPFYYRIFLTFIFSYRGNHHFYTKWLGASKERCQLGLQYSAAF